RAWTAPSTSRAKRSSSRKFPDSWRRPTGSSATSTPTTCAFPRTSSPPSCASTSATCPCAPRTAGCCRTSSPSPTVPATKPRCARGTRTCSAPGMRTPPSSTTPTSRCPSRISARISPNSPSRTGSVRWRSAPTGFATSPPRSRAPSSAPEPGWMTLRRPPSPGQANSRNSTWQPTWWWSFPPSPAPEALFRLDLTRHAGAALPASTPGALLALADRFDLLMAMFAVGAKPTGSSDPFALRRAALGAALILRAHGELGALDIPAVTSAAAERLRAQGIEIPDDAEAAVVEFVTGRFAQLLRDEGVSAEAIAAVEPLLSRPDRAAALLEEIAAATGAVTAADGPARAEFAALVEQVQRITRLVPRGTSAAVQREHLSDPAELVLADAIA